MPGADYAVVEWKTFYPQAFMSKEVQNSSLWLMMATPAVTGQRNPWPRAQPISRLVIFAQTIPSQHCPPCEIAKYRFESLYLGMLGTHSNDSRSIHVCVDKADLRLFTVSRYLWGPEHSPDAKTSRTLAEHMRFRHDKSVEIRWRE
jgi:hypothetical protein